MSATPTKWFGRCKGNKSTTSSPSENSSSKRPRMMNSIWSHFWRIWKVIKKLRASFWDSQTIKWDSMALAPRWSSSVSLWFLLITIIKLSSTSTILRDQLRTTFKASLRWHPHRSKLGRLASSWSLRSRVSWWTSYLSKTLPRKTSTNLKEVLGKALQVERKKAKWIYSLIR